LNTIQVQQGLDKVCIHSIKDIHKRNNVLKVQAVLMTSNAIKDVLFVPDESDNQAGNLLSETKLKSLIVKGLYRYSSLNLG
jgi:porphobilinogen deaminase